MSAAAVASAAPAPGSSSAGQGRHLGKITRYQLDGTALVTGTRKTRPAATGAIATFSQSNVDQNTGTSYTDTYVGTAPASNTSSTTAVNLIPLNLRLSNRNGTYTTVSSTSTTSTVAGSPLFTNTTTKPVGESTQYIDAYVRANWNKVGSGYHVNLTATTQPAVTVTFSAKNWFMTSSGQYVLNDATLSPAVRAKLANYSSSAFNAFLAPNIVGCQTFTSTSASNCYGGYHDYYNSRTFAISTVDGSSHQNLQAFSHETAEWAMDPFVNNVAPNWTAGAAYGCDNYLEVGDPVYTSTYASGSWTLEDEVYNSWFFHTSPAPTANNAYSLLGLTTSATAC